MKYHHTPIKMAPIKKKRWLGCGEVGTLLQWWWECKMVRLLWKTSEVPQKFKHKTTIWSSNSTSGYIAQRIKILSLKSYLHTSVNSSIIHNNQEVETTQIFTNGWMDKQMWYIHKALKRKEVLSHATAWINLEDIMLNEIYQLWKRQILYKSIYIRYLESNPEIEHGMVVAIGGREKWRVV